MPYSRRHSEYVEAALPLLLLLVKYLSIIEKNYLLFILYVSFLFKVISIFEIMFF